MNNYNLIVKEEADREVIDAFHWYEDKSKGLGERFLEALDECYDSIDVNPATYQKVYKEHRQAVVKVFPYVVIYELSGNDIIVYAVFNTHRDPKDKIR